MGAGYSGGITVILYHFCCERDMRGIRNKGITKGMICCETRIPQPAGKPDKWSMLMIQDWQWITLDGERCRQSWATQFMIHYDRTEYRWTIDMPEKETDSLYDRDRLAERFPGSERLFDEWAGSENWRVYHGPIPKKWLVKLEHWNREEGEWEEIWAR